MTRKTNSDPQYLLQSAEASVRRMHPAKRRDAGGVKVILEGLLLFCLVVVVGAVVFMAIIHGKGAAWAVDRAFSVALWAMGAAALLGALLLGIHLFSRKS